MNQSFETEFFDTPDRAASRLVEFVDDRISRTTRRVLEIGCGTGRISSALAARHRDTEFWGVDLSPSCIAEATRRDASVQFVVGDYVAFSRGVFDLIFCDSVLQLIECDDERLAAKIARDLPKGGLLIATLPYDCVTNHAIYITRRITRHVPSWLTDRIGLVVAKSLHPDWSVQDLRSRVTYLRLLPQRLDGARWRAIAAKYGLAVQRCAEWPSPSLFKPRHRVVVFERL
jgi:trans-aconitate methyltransferase